MKRSLLNLTVDLIAAVSLGLMVITGYILRFPLPPATNRSAALWGMSRHEWGTVHAWAGAGMLGVLLLHVILHWDWIYATIRRRFTGTTAAPTARRRVGVIAIVVVLVASVLFAWVAQISVRERENPPRHSRLGLAPSHQPAISQTATPDGVKNPYPETHRIT